MKFVPRGLSPLGTFKLDKQCQQLKHNSQGSALNPAKGLSPLDPVKPITWDS
jgi:hypothetical protein